MIFKPSEFFEKKKIQEQLQQEVVEPEEKTKKISRIKSPSDLFGDKSIVVEIEETVETIVEEVEKDPIEEIRILVEEVRSQIPDIPEIKTYDSELNFLKKELDKVYNIVYKKPYPKYYDEDVKELHQKIDSIDIPETPEIPKVKYYDEDIQELHQRIDSIDIPEIPKIKYYDAEIYNLGEEISQIESKISKLPEVKYYDEDIQELYQKIDGIRIPEIRYYENDISDIHQKIDSIHIPEVKYYDEDVKELHQKIDSIDIPKIPEVKYYDEDIQKLHQKIDGIEIPEVKYYDEDIQELHQKIDGIQIPEVKSYDEDINDLKTNIGIVKLSIKEPKSYDDDIEELRRIIKEIKEKQENLVLTEGLINEPPESDNEDTLTPLTQNFATLDDLQNHYKLFITRIQQQLSTLGGGGETRLEFLDDVDRTSAKTDGYYLRYNASIGKFVGAAVTGGGGGGSQNLDQTLQLGNVSSLGMSVGIITATSFEGDGSNLTGVSTFSGDYNDLTNKPSIPSDTGDLTNSVGFVTSGIVVGYATEGYVNNIVAISTFSGNYNDLTNRPTALSSFTNDVGFITSYTETSTLNDVLSRGNTSSSGISVGVVTASSVNSNTLLLSNANIITILSTKNSISQDTIDTFDITEYRSATYDIQITRQTFYHTTTLKVLHDGSEVYLTEYGSIKTGDSLSSFSADIVGGNVRILGTPSSAETTTFKIVRTAIKI